MYIYNIHFIHLNVHGRRSCWQRWRLSLLAKLGLEWNSFYIIYYIYTYWDLVGFEWGWMVIGIVGVRKVGKQNSSTSVVFFCSLWFWVWGHYHVGDLEASQDCEPWKSDFDSLILYQVETPHVVIICRFWTFVDASCISFRFWDHSSELFKPNLSKSYHTTTIFPLASMIHEYTWYIYIIHHFLVHTHWAIHHFSHLEPKFPRSWGRRTTLSRKACGVPCISWLAS